jgi:hypothetical protein
MTTQKKKLIIDSSSEEEELEEEEVLDCNLKPQFEKLKDCNDENYYSTECNNFVLKKELCESKELSNNPDSNPYLYPNLNDKNFNIKIATKKEFNDTKYEGPDFSKTLKEHADDLANMDYYLQPHQAFIKNFMSFQTPYNSLLLYHGLGSGKTCSAIGVCEEMREYMKQMGINNKILIVASENVQDNFKLQMFDERKLKLIDGNWNMKGCLNNKLLQEVNPMNMKGMPREKVISQVKNLINANYQFLGYEQFANYIIKTMNFGEDMREPKNDKSSLNKRIIRRLRNEFDNRQIVIDEVHNIRKSDNNANKKVAVNLELLVKSARNMRFLLLSATPMYNSCKEIVWLLNLMNMNDRRSKIDTKDIFDKNGNFKKNGEEMLIRKATGYVSFVRGENPYTFPFRVYPNEFAKEHTFKRFNKAKLGFNYPIVQMNGMKILNNDKKRILSLYLNKIGECNNCGECQYCCYKYIIHNLKNKKFSITTKTGDVRNMPNFENMDSFGYTLLQTPLQTLIISYPYEKLKSIITQIADNTEQQSAEFDEEFAKASILINKPNKKYDKEQEGEEQDIDQEGEEQGEEGEGEEVAKKVRIEQVKETNPEFSVDPRLLTGRTGLERMMTFIDEKSPPEKGSYEYKKTTLDKYGRIFSQDLIGKYSVKIKCILDNIANPENDTVSNGIILIYSQYIDSGLIPMALALEEMGFTRYGENAKPLFKNKPTNIVDVKTMKPPTNKKDFIPARYSIISGDPRLSPNNDYEVKGLTNEDNKYGDKIKVVLISRAGSEGIDLKYIRQVHILEPWYNMNHIEQIIGRAVRNFSHKDLDFEQRNVEIFMHGTIVGKENIEEAADLYVYRVAEFKAKQIGRITRVLKESAVDCIINSEQQQFTQEIMSKNLKTPIKQILSNGFVISEFKVGDAPFSPACDYMASCDYSCLDIDKKKLIIDEKNLNIDTYDEKYISNNSDKIVQRIRMLMKESFFYIKEKLIGSINIPKEYPRTQIFAALTKLIEDKNEFIVDKYGRNGRLINIGEYYLFQPIELRDNNISIFDRMVPIDYKHEMINFEIKEDIKKPAITKVDDVIKNGEMDFEEKEKEIKEQKEKINMKAKEIIKQFESDMQLTNEYFMKPFGSRVERGDDNWYKHCGIILQKINKTYNNLNNEMLKGFVIAHMIELLMYEEKLDIMNYLYTLDNVVENSVEYYAKKYFEKYSIVTPKFKAFILYNINKRMIMIYDNNRWIEATREDQIEIARSEEAREDLIINNPFIEDNDKKSKKELEDNDKKQFNKLVGFIGYEKNNKFLMFKTKNMESTRDTGAICDNSGKAKAQSIIKSILNEEKYNELIMAQQLQKIIVKTKDELGNNIKTVKYEIVLDDNNKPVKEIIGQVEMCVLLENLLRYFNEEKIQKANRKVYFLRPEMAIYHKLYKVIK